MKWIGEGLWLCEKCGGKLRDPGDRTNRPCTLCLVRPLYPPPEPQPANGAGTELKKLLKGWGIEPTPGCKCDKRAKAMDKRGAQWCAENAETIVGWLREEAKRQKLPFVEWFARRLVKRAIQLAFAWEESLAVASVGTVLVPVVVPQEVSAAAGE